MKHLFVGTLLAVVLPVQLAHAQEPAPAPSVVVVFDLSFSMHAIEATDEQVQDGTALPPSRFERARSALVEVIGVLGDPAPGPIGLVGFGTEAFVFSEPTTDMAALRTIVSNLEVGAIDASAGATGDGVARALALLADADGRRQIVLLADGVSAGSVSLAQAGAMAADEGIPVTTLFLATGTDTYMLSSSPFGGGGVQTVDLELDPAPFEELASTTGGAFHTVATTGDVRAVLVDVLGPR